MKKGVWTPLSAAVVFVAAVAVACLAPTGYTARWPTQAVSLVSQGDSAVTVTLHGSVTGSLQGAVLVPTMGMTPASKTVTLPELIYAYLAPYHDVLPRDTVYQGTQTGATDAGVSSTTQATQQAAIVAGLREAGIPVNQFPMVAQVRQSGPAYGHLEMGDLISAVDGVSVASAADMTQAIRAKSVGATVVLSVIRSGATLQVTLTLTGSTSDIRVATAGITAVNGYYYEPHVDVSTSLTEPSQGFALALGVYALTATFDVTNAHTVAAIGTMDADGSVGAVSGMNEMARSAMVAHADYLFVPQGSCQGLTDSFDGMTIIPVRTLHQAVDVLSRDDPASMPRC